MHAHLRRLAENAKKSPEGMDLLVLALPSGALEGKDPAEIAERLLSDETFMAEDEGWGTMEAEPGAGDDDEYDEKLAMVAPDGEVQRFAKALLDAERAGIVSVSADCLPAVKRAAMGA